MIKQLHNLLKLSTFNDIYYNKNTCFLEDLFKNNKLEYVYMFN